MATLLHRLGLASARRPWAAILAWLIALALAVGAFLAFSGTLTTAVTIPGTPTAQVTDRLKEQFPDAAKGTGQVVFATEDGSAFTEAQRRAVGDALRGVEGQDAVDSVMDPFDVARQQDEARTALEDGRRQIAEGEQKIAENEKALEDGRAQLAEAKDKADAGQKELDAAAAQLDAGQEKLDAARADLEARGLDALPAEATAPLTEAQQKLDAGQAEYDAGVAALEEQRPALEAAEAEVAKQEATLEQAQARFEAGRAQAIAQAEAAGATPEQAAAAVDARLAPEREKLDAGAAQLEEARARTEAGRAEFAAGEEKLAAAAAELEQGRAQLAAGREKALAAARAELDAQQQKIDAGRAEHEQGVRELEAGRAEIAQNEAKLADGPAQLEQARKDLAAGREKADRGERMLTLTDGYRVVSEDGSAALGTVAFDRPSLDVTTEQTTAVIDAMADADIPGVRAIPTQALNATMPSLIGPGEVVGLAVAALVLVLMLGTLVGAGLPLVNALIGVGVGAAGALAFSGVVEMMSVTPVLGIMLGLAVGIDYALFIVNRHRLELKRGTPLHASIALANGTSGNAVVFAGITVVIALVALNVTGIPFLGLMGTVGAVCVAVAVLVAVTLTPALLSLAGMRILSRKERAGRAAEAAPVADDAAAPSGSHAAAPVSRSAAGAVRDARRRPRMSTPAAVATVLASAAALIVVAIPFGSMRLGLPDGASEPVGSDSQVSYELIADEFGEGYNGPLVVTVDLPSGLDETAAEDAQVQVGEQLKGLEHVAAVVPAGFNQDRTTAMFQVLPEEGPNAISTGDLVHTLRDTEPAGEASNLGVAGVTSGFIDVSEKLSAALPLYLGVVVGLSLLIMILVFRSILVPLIATGGFVLSVFAAMGGVVAIYQWGWLGGLFNVHAPGPVLSFLPTIMIGVLFGLAMDYQLFIASGMREAYAHGQPARDAVMTGLRAGRAVVTAAAIIMISVFGGFVFSHDAMIRPIGFGLAFGVLLDAFVVRLLLMPALMHLLGDAAWWLPKWLDRILPDVDVEGAGLERHGAAGEAADAAPVGADRA
ncbi:MMPL family transporter [Micrococcus porci]|uniref:MMPL family transporter n=1 Tax=Micrococcus porci TaxID=2856555 RepID=UPI003CEEAF96